MSDETLESLAEEIGALSIAEKFELVSQLIKAKQFKLAYRIATLAMLEYPKEYRS